MLRYGKHDLTPEELQKELASFEHQDGADYRNKEKWSGLARARGLAEDLKLSSMNPPLYRLVDSLVAKVYRDQPELLDNHTWLTATLEAALQEEGWPSDDFAEENKLSSQPAQTSHSKEENPFRLALKRPRPETEVPGLSTKLAKRQRIHVDSDSDQG